MCALSPELPPPRRTRTMWRRRSPSGTGAVLDDHPLRRLVRQQRGQRRAARQPLLYGGQEHGQHRRNGVRCAFSRARLGAIGGDRGAAPSKRLRLRRVSPDGPRALAHEPVGPKPASPGTVSLLPPPRHPKPRTVCCFFSQEFAAHHGQRWPAGPKRLQPRARRPAASSIREQRSGGRSSSKSVAR